jgi:hypothetical protein
MPARARAALLPDDSVLGTTPSTAVRRARLRRIEPAREPDDAPPRLPHQLYHEPPHRRLRSRPLLALTDLRGLSGRIPPLALHRLAPPLRRISPGPVRTTTTTAAAAAAAAECVGGAAAAAPRVAATAVRHAVAQSRARERHRGLHGTVAVHRDVLRRGSRVSRLPWIQVSESGDGGGELWRRVHRQLGWGYARRGCAGRRARSVGELVLQRQLKLSKQKDIPSRGRSPYFYLLF